MTAILRLRPEVQDYLETTLCRLKKEHSECRLSCLLDRLSEPPLTTTLRMNLQKASADEISQKLHAVLVKQYAKRQGFQPEIYIHPQVTDCLVVTNKGPESIVMVEKEVIVDAVCGAAVLRGSDVYACGILAAPAGMQPGDVVSLYADLNGLCRRGLVKPFDGPKCFLGNGRACISRHDIFSSEQRGLGIEMTEPLYLAPSLSDVLTDLIFPQNLPSIVCVHVLDPHMGETVLDMCAAPGGKTTHIASLMENKGHVIALDRSKNKIAKIKENLSCWGLSCVNVYCFDGTKSVSTSDGLPLTGPPPYSVHSFDRILLDAPCSGLGRRPMLSNDMSLREVKSYPPLQKKLFEKAVELLKDNGVLVYSTCTITLEENEDIVAWALKTFPLLKLVSQIPHLGGTGISGSRLKENNCSLVQRFGPITGQTNKTTDVDSDTIGFFIAKFVKMPEHTES